jgi:hypothetical protein
MESNHNPVNLHMVQGSENPNQNRESFKENSFETEIKRPELVSDRKGKRPRIQRPIYSAKLA